MSFNGTSEGGNRHEEMEDCGGRDCDGSDAGGLRRGDGERTDAAGKSGDCRRREPGNGTWLCIQLAGTG